MKFRGVIARALPHFPALLLHDEATVGLDVKACQGISGNLHDETAAGCIGVLWASHLTEEVALYDPGVVLHQCRVKAHGLARTLAPERDLVAAFLAPRKRHELLADFRRRSTGFERIVQTSGRLGAAGGEG